MTTLKGTEKQISWASEIRDNFFKERKNAQGQKLSISIYETWKGTIENLFIKRNAQEHHREMARKLVESIQDIDSAKFWIENRESLTMTIHVDSSTAEFTVKNDGIWGDVSIEENDAMSLLSVIRDWK